VSAEPNSAPAPSTWGGWHPATLLAGAAMVLSGGLLLHWLSRLTFWRDEWGLLLHRRGWSVGTFLDPAVEHLTALPILIYKVLLDTAGMDSPAPFQVVGVLTFLLSVGLLFVYVRLRVGEWLALAAILPILFLGPSWDDLLFPYQVGFFGSVACGIGALLCLDRSSRGRDIAATVLIVASLLFSDVGLPFVAAAAVIVALDPERLRRAYVAAVPAVLWLIWYLGWGHTAHTFVSLHNAANLPSYVIDGVSSSLATLVGLNSPTADVATSPLDWGRPLLVLAVVVAAWRIRRLGKPPGRTLAALAVLLGFWSLTALNASVFGLPTVGRYQYIGVVGVVLVAAELAQGVPVPRWAVVTILAVSVAAAVSNVSVLRDAAKGLVGIAQQERGGLAALELDRGEVAPGLELTEENSGVDYLGLLDAGSYLSAVDAFGSPAYSATELVNAPEAGQAAADRVSALALGVKLVPASGTQGVSCVDLNPGVAAVVGVPADGLLVTARSPGTQGALHRYASQSFPVALGTLHPGEQELLRIPRDGSSRPWSLQLTGGGRVTACRAPAASG
jgi:hypothetical protein